VSFIEAHRKDIAKQLTKTCAEIYERLETEEFLKQSWSKPKTQHLSPNVMEMINFFNKIGNWIASVIISEPLVRDRAQLVLYFIKIAGYLRKLNNYHLVIAIISGINNSAVSRLKWTMKKVPLKYKEKLVELEALMSMEGSFKKYRAAYQSSLPPCIPYLGVALQDLTFVDENPDKIGELVNFNKMRLIYTYVSDTLKFQPVPYADIQHNEDIQVFIEKLPSLFEKDMYDKSLQLEPRNAARSEIK